MSFDDIRSGTVIDYPYLWAWQAEGGETEGRKARPTAVALRLGRPTGDLVVLLAITTKQPSAERWSIEVPQVEKVRAGLDPSLRQWILLDESNQDVVGKSYYLRPREPLGRFSAGFFAPIVQQVIDRWRATRHVPRR
jgi:hypothetical protein